MVVPYVAQEGVRALRAGLQLAWDPLLDQQLVSRLKAMSEVLRAEVVPPEVFLPHLLVAYRKAAPRQLQDPFPPR